jgi:predicted ATPase
MIENRKNNFFVLVGTSGTGKSTVLQELNSLGYQCSSEAARSILSEQLAMDGPALPSKNPKLFIEYMLNLSITNFEDSERNEELCFFDRGIPDLVHYAIRFNVDVSLFKTASEKYLYNKRVFLFNPWEEIFINDNERRMTFEKAIEFHEILIRVYNDCGYELLVVPQLEVENRAKFILEHSI